MEDIVNLRLPYFHFITSYIASFILRIYFNFNYKNEKISRKRENFFLSELLNIISDCKK